MTEERRLRIGVLGAGQIAQLLAQDAQVGMRGSDADNRLRITGPCPGPLHVRIQAQLIVRDGLFQIALDVVGDSDVVVGAALLLQQTGTLCQLQLLPGVVARGVRGALQVDPPNELMRGGDPAAVRKGGIVPNMQ